MFSKIIESLRTTNNPPGNPKPSDIPERRASLDETGEHHAHYALSKVASTGSMPSSQPITIENSDAPRRRRSSLFGYSKNAADDYMQKDLISGSWS
ncbi:hypothetical protein BC940DRAFT_309474 [Gongronella butleri]|nr:hypothetical protein BC940DRAFT_309474 [Gongronella butleri]